jgi:predicted  nucleic acid-binding Zn-ribbon protein
MWQCQECGRRFRSVAAAERASMNGCPKCGGVDIDLAAPVDDDGWNEVDQRALEAESCE